MNHKHLIMIDEVVTLLVHPVHETTKFETLLTEWQPGGPAEWAELMAAWLEMPTAPVSRTLVLRLILGLIEK